MVRGKRTFDKLLAQSMRAVSPSHEKEALETPTAKEDTLTLTPADASSPPSPAQRHVREVVVRRYLSHPSLAFGGERNWQTTLTSKA